MGDASTITSLSQLYLASGLKTSNGVGLRPEPGCNLDTHRTLLDRVLTHKLVDMHHARRLA